MNEPIPVSTNDLIENPPDGLILYSAYDATDRLLYVGQTGDLANRLGAHRGQSEWWPLACRFTTEQFAEQQALDDAELKAICWKGPIYNRDGIDSRTSTRARSDAAQRYRQVEAIRGLAVAVESGTHGAIRDAVRRADDLEVSRMLLARLAGVSGAELIDRYLPSDAPRRRPESRNTDQRLIWTLLRRRGRARTDRDLKQWHADRAALVARLASSGRWSVEELGRALDIDPQTVKAAGACHNT